MAGENFVTWILSSVFTGWMGIFLYWLPLSICSFGYTVRTATNYQKDLENREKYEEFKLKCSEFEEGTDEYRSFIKSCKENDTLHEYYCPTDTIGTVLGRILVTVVPIINLWAGIFDISPNLFCNIFMKLEKLFDQPLVPKK